MTFLSLLKAWLIILPFMIVNGIVRELVIKRMVPSALAEAISVALGIAIVVLVTSRVLRPLAGKSAADLVRASVTLVGLTVTFEFLFGHYVDHKSWSELAANYAIWNGRLWPILLAIIAGMPFVWGRWSRVEATHAG